MPCVLVTALLGSLAVGMLFCRQHWYKICWCIFFKQIPGIVWVFLWQKYTAFCVSRCRHAPPSLAAKGLYVMFPAHVHSERGGKEDPTERYTFFSRQGLPRLVFVRFL